MPLNLTRSNNGQDQGETSDLVGSTTMPLVIGTTAIHVPWQGGWDFNTLDH